MTGIAERARLGPEVRKMDICGACRSTEIIGTAVAACVHEHVSTGGLCAGCKPLFDNRRMRCGECQSEAKSGELRHFNCEMRLIRFEPIQ